MNTNLQQQAGRRLDWARISGIGFAGAFHLAAFMVILAPAAVLEGPPPRPRPLVYVDSVKPTPKPPPAAVPMPEAPPLAQQQEPPLPQPPIQRDVVNEVPMVVLEDMSAPVMVAVQDALSRPAPVAQVADSDPRVLQSYGDIAAIPYPTRARKQRQEGEVMLRVLVSVAGDPINVEVETSSGHRVLDVAAQKAVGKWKFNPGLSNGQPIQGWVLVPINFSLK